MDNTTRLAKLSEAQDMYSRYLAAEQAILTGQSYSIGDRTLTRADLSAVVKSREQWAAKVCAYAENKIGIRFKRVLPRDV